MPFATIPLALLLLVQCSAGESSPQDRPAKPGKQQPAVLTMVLQRERDATEQLLLHADGHLLRVRFTGSRVLDATEARLDLSATRQLHDLARSLSQVARGKRDEEYMDGAEFTVLHRLSPARPVGKQTTPPLTVHTHHEDLIAKPLRQALHTAFDRPPAGKPLATGSWVRARPFATAMGLSPAEAKDIPALLRRQGLAVVPTVPAWRRALAWPGVLIPCPGDKLPKAAAGKPPIVRSGQRYFVLDSWSFQRK